MGYRSIISLMPKMSIVNKVVYDFSDTKYFQATTNAFGGGVTGTKRLVFRVESLPSGGQKVIVSKLYSGTGWYVRTLGAVIDVVMNGASTISAGFTILAGHVGQSFVLHFTNDGTSLKMYINGLSAGAAANSTGSPNPSGAALFNIGTYQLAPSLFNPHLGVQNYNETASVLSDAQVDADATAIINQGSSIVYQEMTSSIHNLVADDLTSGSNWTDRISGTINVYGLPTVANI